MPATGSPCVSGPSGRAVGNSSQPARAGVGWCRYWTVKMEISENTLTRRAIVVLGASYEVGISENTGRNPLRDEGIN